MGAITKVYLNNAATSYPKPETVVSAVSRFINSMPFHSSRSGFSEGKDDILDACRKKLASLINTKKQSNIIFTSGATESLNLAIFGNRFSEAHIITTAAEHNSVLRPLKLLEKQGKISLDIVEADSSGIINPKSICKKINKKTKAIIVNHCSNVTGLGIDLEEIGQITNSNGIKFIVDASQSIGSINIDVEKFSIDILAFTGHKQLFGLQGIGGIFIKDDLSLEPLKVGGTGVKSELLFQPDYMPVYYEAGTQNYSGIVSLNAGLDFIFETGIEEIRNKKNELFRFLIQEMANIPGITMYSDNSREKNPVLPFNINRFSPEDTVYILENSYGIITRSGLHCAPLIHQFIGTSPLGCARISLSYFNTFEEIEYLLKSLKEIAT